MTDPQVDLEAKLLEYEHALEHVAEDHNGACPDCQALAQSALDRVNRQGFIEVVEDDIMTEEKFRIVESCARKLSQVLTPGELVMWFTMPNSHLDDFPPIDCLNDIDSLRKAVLAELADG